MYVCRWIGYDKEYLVSLVNGSAEWNPNLQKAKRFETREEAERYLIVRDANTGKPRRGWNENLMQVIFIHPLNLKNV